MANKVKLVSSTQIYRDTRTLMNHIIDVTPQFPRQFKYSIGAKMHDLVVDLLNSAASAYLIRDKETSISHLVQYLSCRYLVTVEAQNTEIVYTLYKRPKNE